MSAKSPNVRKRSPLLALIATIVLIVFIICIVLFGGDSKTNDSPDHTNAIEQIHVADLTV